MTEGQRITADSDAYRTGANTTEGMSGGLNTEVQTFLGEVSDAGVLGRTDTVGKYANPMYSVAIGYVGKCLTELGGSYDDHAAALRNSGLQYDNTEDGNVQTVGSVDNNNAHAPSDWGGWNSGTSSTPVGGHDPGNRNWSDGPDFGQETFGPSVDQSGFDPEVRSGTQAAGLDRAGNGYGPGSAGYGFGPGSAGNGPGTTGYGPGTSGYGPGTSGYGPGTSGYGPGTSGYGPGTSGYGPGTSGYAPGTSGYGPGTSGYGPGSAGQRPGGAAVPGVGTPGGTGASGAPGGGGSASSGNPGRAVPSGAAANPATTPGGLSDARAGRLAGPAGPGATPAGGGGMGAPMPMGAGGSRRRDDESRLKGNNHLEDEAVDGQEAEQNIWDTLRPLSPQEEQR